MARKFGVWQAPFHDEQQAKAYQVHAEYVHSKWKQARKKDLEVEHLTTCQVLCLHAKHCLILHA